ncbi:MAG: 3-phosphoserine/phosphohydroxythreonine transaminase, partial [Acidimicrobiia bacterium]
HRSAEYDAVHEETMRLTRSVSGAPEDFAILFVQGGATLQFGMIPMNLLSSTESAGYVVTGSWAKAAFSDAKAAGNAYAAWDGADHGYTTMPTPGEVSVEPGTRYLHVTTNETIGGIRMIGLPDVGVPLVGDMSSEYLARPIDWDRFDLVYGGVQKNLAPSGMVVLFVRKALIESSPAHLPKYLRYDWHAAANSLANTPAMFSTYVMGKVLARIETAGGVPALEAQSAEKAGLLYRAIDESDGFFRNPVDPAVRSHMNVVFRLPTDDLEKRFLAEAERRHMVGLKGHRSVGGCRASLYAALGLSSVEALVGLMEEFADDHREA